MGFVSAVCEMLVRSRPGFLRLLPALPDAWPEGSVRGITTRCGVEVGMTWSERGRVLSVDLSSRLPQQITLHLPGHFSPSRRTIDLPSGSVSYEFRADSTSRC